MQTKGILLTVLSAVCFGITPLLTTAVYSYGVNSITVVFFRQLFVLPVLYVIMKAKHIRIHMEQRDLINIGIIAILGSGLTTILLFTSYSYIDVGTATTLHFLYPICVSVLCFFFYKERLGRNKIIALCLAAIGTLCFFQIGNGTSITGLLLAASSALTYAFYMVQLEKTHLAHHNAFKISFYIAFFILLETIAYHICIPVIHLSLPLPAYGLLMVLSMVSSFIAVILLQLGIKYLGPSTASLFCLFEPVTSIICGKLFLNEQLTPIKMIGCLVILSALVIMTLSEQKKHKQKSDISDEI